MSDLSDCDYLNWFKFVSKSASLLVSRLDDSSCLLALFLILSSNFANLSVKLSLNSANFVLAICSSSSLFC